ncbi:MAG: anti-sigma factor antagonist [Streptosporangiaceae bacterium]|nr:anti-sigma-factor antagonist [Streptosporangiaceae bacterium]MDX6433502.1 anti-sigma factor antagonist [Streptosporangiaceae bacterium]
MDFTLDHRLNGDLTIVTVKGEIDVFTSPKLRETLLELVESGALHLVFDLGEVDLLDSTGLGVLIGIYNRLRSRGGSMTLAGANDRVHRVFHVTQLTKIFVLYGSLEEAVRASAFTGDTTP